MPTVSAAEAVKRLTLIESEFPTLLYGVLENVSRSTYVSLFIVIPQRSFLIGKLIEMSLMLPFLEADTKIVYA